MDTTQNTSSTALYCDADQSTELLCLRLHPGLQSCSGLWLCLRLHPGLQSCSACGTTLAASSPMVSGSACGTTLAASSPMVSGSACGTTLAASSPMVSGSACGTTLAASSAMVPGLAYSIAQSTCSTLPSTPTWTWPTVPPPFHHPPDLRWSVWNPLLALLCDSCICQSFIF
ncbi:uncharacterized protein LOC113656075 [Tachysurus fulvidraco]|uniref:uncharacterized protein LOC113656075 n=1 Tax=Tachysurus fulvidraco TaxID=1234273 RepID=UPI001FEE30B2|nr:uncharacterized protein LOC113656075 [Tachysurus fulvidraco]